MYALRVGAAYARFYIIEQIRLVQILSRGVYCFQQRAEGLRLLYFTELLLDQGLRVAAEARDFDGLHCYWFLFHRLGCWAVCLVLALLLGFVGSDAAASIA